MYCCADSGKSVRSGLIAFFSAFLFPEARLLLVSTKNHDLWKVQFSEYVQGNHFLFSANQICHTDSEHVESDSDSQCITDFWCWTSFLNVAILGADQKRVWSLGTRLSFLCLPRNAALVLCDNPSWCETRLALVEKLSLQWWKHDTFHSMDRDVIQGAFWTRSHRSTQRVCNSKKSNGTNLQKFWH